MSSTSLTFSSRVAGQPLLSLETSRRSLSKSCSPLSPFSSNTWDMQNREDVYYSDEDWESSSSSSGAETMMWDSPPPSASGLPEPLLNSVVEDWNYDPLPSPIPTVIIEEQDGAQTVVIDPQSPFFSPPLAPRSSGSETRFSLGLPPNPKRKRDIIPDGVPASAISPSAASVLEGHRYFEPEQAEQAVKGQMLFVVTASLQGGFALSSPLFYSLRPIDEVEVTLWAPKGLSHGPDVPLDSIYPSGDYSTTGNWDETPWSPMPAVPYSYAF
ncbi:hypothetical protein M413DRAFT_31369 [Hebeloma cylindrosporum]|uniref:Uncharacterized protein n=1 Tax=Hebeloma cylindrosporum TaxID=76867 RepID=A0A0C3BXF3_HEBCY|nr:hypothetical protein M413DRAFT_31369 [Hebeloma cylindrosporum h7]